MNKRSAHKLIAGMLLLLAIMLSACSGIGDQQELAGTSWELLSMPGYDDLGEVLVTLNFDAEGGVGGNGGCNSYGGSYASSASERTISFSQIFSTEMYCMGNNASEIEAEYFKLLNEVENYSIDFEFLRIYGAQGLLQFLQAP